MVFCRYINTLLLLVTLLLPVAAFSQPSGEIDPHSIFLDGTKTTTASIPFAEGLSVPDGGIAGIPHIRIGSVPDLVYGNTSYMRIWMDRDAVGGFNQVIFGPTQETNTANPYGTYVFFQGGSGPSSVPSYGGGFEFRGGRGYGLGGGQLTLSGGIDNVGGGGSISLEGGRSTGSNKGYIRIGSVTFGSPNRFTLISDDTRASLYVAKLLEVDGTAYLDGALNVVGNTTLASLTGILKATSGLVATASSSDLLTAIGTIDISSNTNLAVSSPITLTGDTVGFDQTANFTWTGTHDFQNNFSWNTSGSTSYLATLGNTGLASAIVSPSGSSDSVSITKQTTTSTTTRGLLVQAEWAGTSTGSSQPVNGFNAFAYTATSATQPLTSTSAQGALRNRMVARHRATNAAATITRMAGLSAGTILDAGVGAVTDAASFIAEAESVGLATTLTNNYGLFTLSNAITGTITNNYGIYVSELQAGTNRFEVFLEDAGRAYFRDASQYLYSSAASTLDDSAATTRNFRINGTTEMSITGTVVDIATNDLAIASGAKFYFEGSGGDTYAYYDSGSSSLKFYVNGALAMELK